MWPEPPSEWQGYQHDGSDQHHHRRHVGEVAGGPIQHLRKRAGADPAGIENAEGALAACRRHPLGTRAVGTDEVPLSATPITGKTASAATSGNGNKAKIPAAVSPSVMDVARTTPSRAPSQPQASLPMAPRAKIRVRAVPIIGRSAPLIFDRNGRNVRNPMRVALSIMAIASSSQKPRPTDAHGATRGLRRVLE